jgi:hypothetical protein
MTMLADGRLICRVINRDCDPFYRGARPVQFIPLYQVVWTTYGRGELEYRNYTIESEPPWGYAYAHKDYDGPEDERCGVGATVEECMMHIDDMEDDN